MPILPEFDVHVLNDAGKDKAVRIAEIYSTALAQIRELVPNSRELSLATTHLQDSAFWAKRGMAVQPENGVAATSTTSG